MGVTLVLIIPNLGDFSQFFRIETASIRVQPSIMNRNRLCSRKYKVLNYGGTGIGTTNAVGAFPGGASVYGNEDMSGNVWEYTRSAWGIRSFASPDFKYPYDARDGREKMNSSPIRVWRGGDFDANENFSSCTFRWHLPYIKYMIRNNHGFRVVLSPKSSEK